MKKHVVLIGLPGSGKSTVARLVARELDAALVDVDARIVLEQRKSVSAIFAEDGEAAFRRFERDAVRRALDGPPAVIDAGGGWAAQPGAIETAGNRALLVYLETTPAVAAERVSREGGRPLLEGDVAARMEALLGSREAAYADAHARLNTDRRRPEEVAADVVRLARSHGGW